MGLRQINGEWVDVPDDITPEGLANIERQMKRQARVQRRQSAQQAQPTPQQRAQTGEQRELTRRIENVRAHDAGLSWGERAFDTLTWGNRSRIAGGVNAVVQGVPKAIAQGDIGQVGREYRLGRDVEEQRITDYNNENPGMAMAADVGGALINPAGTGASAVAAAGRGLGRAGARRAAARALRVSRRMERAGPIAQGAMAGALQGGLTGASQSDSLSEVPENLMYGAGYGAAGGAAFGGALHIGRKASQIIGDARPANAARTAYGRVAEDLENAGKMPPSRVRQEIQDAEAQGGDLRVMDVAPNLQVRASDISRRPNVPRSNEMIDLSRERLYDRPARFAENVEGRAGLGSVDAEDTIAAIQASRKARGALDYAEGGAMDIPIQPTMSVIRTVRAMTENPAVETAVRKGILDAQSDGLDLGNFDPTTLTHIPTLRVFDYVKRRMDDVIGSALKAGNRTEARRVSEQVRAIKDEIATQNTEYADILKAQRDKFEQADAVELGQMVMKNLGSKPRQMLKMVNGLNDNQRLSARIGIVDQLINLETKGDPVQQILSMMRLPQQRKVLEFAFGGSKQVDSFKGWLRREAMAKETDRQIAPGRTSDTARFQVAADEGDGGLASVAIGTAKGQAFGGPMGGIANMIARLSDIAHSNSKYVHNELARILMSKGEDLEQGIRETARYVANRKRANRKYSMLAGKSLQQPISNTLVGDDNAL